MHETQETVSIPGSRRFPGVGNGSPLQKYCLENSMDRGAWWIIAQRAANSQTWLSTHKHWLLGFVIITSIKTKKTMSVTRSFYVIFPLFFTTTLWSKYVIVSVLVFERLSYTCSRLYNPLPRASWCQNLCYEAYYFYYVECQMYDQSP